ncbi:hypothetical protein ABPG73_003848 [Tetrahymena malaccensis]
MNQYQTQPSQQIKQTSFELHSPNLLQINQVISHPTIYVASQQRSIQRDNNFIMDNKQSQVQSVLKTSQQQNRSLSQINYDQQIQKKTFQAQIASHQIQQNLPSQIQNNLQQNCQKNEENQQNKDNSLKNNNQNGEIKVESNLIPINQMRVFNSQEQKSQKQLHQFTPQQNYQFENYQRNKDQALSNINSDLDNLLQKMKIVQVNKIASPYQTIQSTQQIQFGINQQQPTANQIQQSLNNQQQNSIYTSRNNFHQPTLNQNENPKNSRYSTNKRSDKMNIVELQLLLKKDASQIREFFYNFQDLKYSLIEIKQIEEFCILLQLCKRMISYDEIANDSIRKAQILDDYKSIYQYIHKYLNSINYEIEIQFYVSSILKENPKLERQKQIQKNSRPQNLQITDLKQIDTNIQNIQVKPDREEFARNTQLINRYSAVPVKGSYINNKNINQEFQQSNTITITAELDMDSIQGDEIANLIQNLQTYFSQSNVAIFEAKYYWQAYSYHLKQIKQMIQNQAQLPFEETIINCKNEVSYPTFINYSTTYSMKIDINQPNTGQKLFIMRDIGRAFEIVNKGTFDSSQFECLSNILTKQVSVIIGPPGKIIILYKYQYQLQIIIGTGKTFVGSMAVKVLVDNYDVWNKQGRPILMICKTNHALDQFLKHILKFEDKIVRIGGRSKEQCLEKYLLGNIKYQYKQSNKKFNTPSLRYLKEQIEEIEELFKQITKEVEDYILLDQDYDIYRKKFDLNLKQMVMNSFQNFVGFRLDYQNRDYYNLQDLILKQWWQCKVDSSEFENFSILTKQQIKIIQDKLNIWIDKMKSQKKQYLEKILNENKIDIQSQDLQNKNHSDANLNEDSDDEENYFENKNEFEVEPSMKIEFLEKQQQNSQFFQVKYNEKELIDLIQNIKLGILNIFNIDYSQAYNLKSYAIQQQQQFALEKIKQLIQNYHLYLQIYNEENSQDDARIILESKCKIIGMTLNGAAINSHLIKHLKSPIIIIEEAGEVLESLLIPVLQPTTQQLILIGDNQQLKPITNNYHLQQYYNFNTSLLERLVKNDVQHAQLKVQRRMNPEFADYIRLIYNQYEDHDDLIRYKKNVVGMPSNMYLISHTQNEDNIENSNSKKNTYEAMYAIKLAKYIIMQKQFKEEEITILSMYLGQCQLIRKLAKQENITQIKISSVDNYQGEENEIVILSLVRSNQNNKLGHAKTQNRINVSFSRAKRGFYVIGNFNMISQVQDAKLWQKIIGLAKKKCHLVESIYFKCNKHKNVNKVTHYQDFDNMVQGGCQKRCNTPLSCGHKCSQICHPDECENYQCINLCKRKIEGCGHECQLNCFEKCKCTSYVQKILLCGHPKVCLCSSDIKNEKCEVKVNVCNNNHKIEVQCFEANLNNLQCKELVSVLPQCGHIKYVKCFQRNLSDHQCVKDILHQLPCKHSVFIKCCDKNKNYECKREVSFKCPKCKISTLKKLCQENSTNVNCTNVIKKKLKCGHYKEVPCNMIPLDATREQEVLKLLKCNCIEQYIFCPHNKYGNKSICPNLHISQEDNQYCVVKCCREQTYTEKFHYIIPE